MKYLDKDGDGVVTKDEAASFNPQPQARNVDHDVATEPRSRQQGVQGAKSAADWKGLGVSEGAPLPPADNSNRARTARKRRKPG
jgi:hypothetical protein